MSSRMGMLALTVLSVLLFVPVTIGEDNSRVLRLLASTNKRLTQLQEESENHKRDLNDLFVQKTEELKELIMQQASSLNALPSEIVSSMKEVNDTEDGGGGECPLQQAMLSLLQDNPNNVTEELASRLSSETTCSGDATSSSDEGDNCNPVPMNPEDTVEMFKIRSRGVGTCTNNDPVSGLNKCHGGCSSTSEYTGGRRMRIITTCSCCQPARFEKIQVSMTCKNGYNFSKDFDNIVECRCLKCNEDKDEASD